MDVNHPTTKHKLFVTSHRVKGCVQLPMGSIDQELGEELARLMRERGLSQMAVADRAGISQTTISRILRAVESGRPVRPLRTATREALMRFLGGSGADVTTQAAILAREMTASILEEMAAMIRSGSAPDGSAIPPTVRRIMAMELDADEPKPAHWDTLERAAEEFSEERKRRRQTRRASGDE